jgi:hypothetical protein
MQGTIDQFKDGEPEKPKLERVVSKWKSETGFFEYSGYDNRGNQVVVSPRHRSEGHRYEKENCYAFDLRVAEKMKRSGIVTVYIVDGDVGNLYEYRLEQFFREGAVKINHERPQLGVPIEGATNWDGYADEFMRSILL